MVYLNVPLVILGVFSALCIAATIVNLSIRFSDSKGDSKKKSDLLETAFLIIVVSTCSMYLIKMHTDLSWMQTISSSGNGTIVKKGDSAYFYIYPKNETKESGVTCP